MHTRKRHAVTTAVVVAREGSLTSARRPATAGVGLASRSREEERPPSRSRDRERSRSLPPPSVFVALATRSAAATHRALSRAKRILLALEQ